MYHYYWLMCMQHTKSGSNTHRFCFVVWCFDGLITVVNVIFKLHQMRWHSFFLHSSFFSFRELIINNYDSNCQDDDEGEKKAHRKNVFKEKTKMKIVELSHYFFGWINVYWILLRCSKHWISLALEADDFSYLCVCANAKSKELMFECEV